VEPAIPVNRRTENQRQRGKALARRPEGRNRCFDYTGIALVVSVPGKGSFTGQTACTALRSAAVATQI
jgi:hypothetical protein